MKNKILNQIFSVGFSIATAIVLIANMPSKAFGQDNPAFDWVGWDSRETFSYWLSINFGMDRISFTSEPTRLEVNFLAALIKPMYAGLAPALTDMIFLAELVRDPGDPNLTLRSIHNQIREELKTLVGAIQSDDSVEIRLSNQKITSLLNQRQAVIGSLPNKEDENNPIDRRNPIKERVDLMFKYVFSNIGVGSGSKSFTDFSYFFRAIQVGNEIAFTADGADERLEALRQSLHNPADVLDVEWQDDLVLAVLLVSMKYLGKYTAQLFMNSHRELRSIEAANERTLADVQRGVTAEKREALAALVAFQVATIFGVTYYLPTELIAINRGFEGATYSVAAGFFGSYLYTNFFPGVVRYRNERNAKKEAVRGQRAKLDQQSERMKVAFFEETPDADLAGPDSSNYIEPVPVIRLNLAPAAVLPEIFPTLKKAFSPLLDLQRVQVPSDPAEKTPATDNGASGTNQPDPADLLRSLAFSICPKAFS